MKIDNLVYEIVTDVKKITKTDDILTNLIYSKVLISKIGTKKGLIL